MTVHPPDEDGWVRVTAKTDDLFAAVQVLLGYGSYCVVVGDVEARTEMKRIVNAMQKLYED